MNAGPNAFANLQDRDAEMAVLGGILLRPELLSILPKLETDDFFDPNHKAVFAAMRNLEAAQRPIDRVTVGDALGPRADVMVWDAVWGDLVLRVPSPEMVEEYAGIVRRHRVARDFLRVCGDSVARVGRGEDASEAMDQLQGALIKIAAGETDNRAKTFGQLVKDEFGHIERDSAARERGETVHVGMPSGIESLDKLTGGIPFGLVTLLMARPGQGKTTLAMRMSWAAWTHGNDTPHVVTYEDGGRSFGQRLIAQHSGVATEAVRSREFNRSDLDSIKKHVRDMTSRGDVLIRGNGMPVEELCRTIKAARRRQTGKVGASGERTVSRLLVIDYFQLIPLPKMHGGTKNDRMGETSKRLVDLAGTEDIAIVLCCQLNRDVEKRDGNGVAKLTDLRDCGELEQDGKLAIAPHRDPKAPNRLELHVIKNHNGKAGVFAEAYWHLATHTICNSATDLPWERNAKR